MKIGEILIWESTNALIPVVIGLVVMLTRWMRGQPVFTERDWLFLVGRAAHYKFSPDHTFHNNFP